MRGIWAWDALPPEEGDSSAAAVYGHPARVGEVLAPRRPLPGRCLGVQGRAPGTQVGRLRGNQGADSEAIPWLHGGGAPGLTQDEAGVRVRTAAPRCGRPLSTRGPGLPRPVRSFPGPSPLPSSPLLSSRGRRLRALGDSTTGLTQGEDFSPRA